MVEFANNVCAKWQVLKKVIFMKSKEVMSFITLVLHF